MHLRLLSHYRAKIKTAVYFQLNIKLETIPQIR